MTLPLQRVFSLAPPPSVAADDGAPSCRHNPCWRDVSFSHDGGLWCATHEGRELTFGATTDARPFPVSAPQISLGSPAMAVAWAPFAQDADDAAVLTTAQRSPIQMWDVSDASLRAAYRRYDAVDELAAARAVCWGAPGTDVYGGYDDGAVCKFDVMDPGRTPVTTYHPKSFGATSDGDDGKKAMAVSCGRNGWGGGRGAVASLAGAVPGVTVSPHLLAAGCLGRPVAEVFDARLRLPAAVLRHASATGKGTTTSGGGAAAPGGVTQIVFDPTDPHRVFTVCRGKGHVGIAVHDLRDVSAPVATLRREAQSHTQRLKIAVVRPGAPGASLWQKALSQSSANAAGDVPVVVAAHQGEAPTLRCWSVNAPSAPVDIALPDSAATGVAASVAVHPDATHVLAACGRREYRPSEARVRVAALPAAASDDDDDDGVAAKPATAKPAKRLRAMSDSDGDDASPRPPSVESALVLARVGTPVHQS